MKQKKFFITFLLNFVIRYFTPKKSNILGKPQIIHFVGRYYLIAGVFLLYSTTICSKTPKAYLSLENAIDAAFKNRSSLISRSYRTRAQENTEWVELSGYFPQISFRTQVGRSARRLLPKHQTFITINQLVFNAAGPIARFNIAKQNTVISDLDEELHKDTIQFETELDFLALWNLVQQHHSIQAQRHSAEKQYRKAQKENIVGLLNSTNWLNQVAIYAEDIAAVKSYRDNLNKAYYILERSIEYDIKTPLANRPTVHFIKKSIVQAKKHSLNYYRKKALIHRKEIPIVEAESIREDYTKKLFERSYIPSVNFFTNISNGTFFARLDSGNTAQTFWQVGFRFEWQLDGLGNAHRSNVSRLSSIERTIERQNIIRQVTVEVERAYYDLQALLKELDAAERRIEQEKMQYTQREAQFNVKELSENEFAQAKRIWEKAQFDLLDLKVKNAKKYRELLFRCGYPENNNQYVSIY